jgi:branched-chain amino acid transport system permease protein
MLLLLLQLAIDGLTSGALYALVAVGFAIIYNGTRILHLAHGAVFTFGGYVLYVLVVLLHLPVPLGIAGTILAAAGFGAAIEVAIYRPLRGRGSSAAALLVASLGVLTLCQAAFALVFGTDTRNLHEGPLPIIEVGDIIVTTLSIVAAVVTILVFPVLQLFLSWSRYGRAIRALADNPSLAIVRGLETGRLHILIFALGSALAGIAVILVAYDLGVTPDMGFNVMFIALVAVIVGGVGYLPGAAAGGFLLGLMQKLSLWQLSGRWQDVIVFGALIAFLVFRPEGLFGHMLASRRV